MSMLLYRVLENICGLLKPNGTFIQVEFDGYTHSEKEFTDIYKQACTEHNLAFQSSQFFENQKIAADVNLKKEAKHKGYVVVVSKKL